MLTRVHDPSRLLELRQVEKVYGTGESRVDALAGIDLTVCQGEFVAVMGASGSGKSTCLNVLGCLDRPSSGTYRFAGVDVGQLSLDQLAILRREYIGFIFQGFNLLARTSALENVELPLVYRRVPRIERRERALHALAAVGLHGREHHKPNELSGGQQQRVAIARAMVTEPRLVLADEPTGNVDSARKVEIMHLLAALNREQDITLVVVTHEQDVASYCHRVVHFADGHITADGPVEKGSLCSTQF